MWTSVTHGALGGAKLHSVRNTLDKKVKAFAGLGTAAAKDLPRELTNVTEELVAITHFCVGCAGFAPREAGLAAGESGLEFSSLTAGVTGHRGAANTRQEQHAIAVEIMQWSYDFGIQAFLALCRCCPQLCPGQWVGLSSRLASLEPIVACHVQRADSEEGLLDQLETCGLLVFRSRLQLTHPSQQTVD
ncbi:hypothetical protein CYMTET_26735 [Cymbomonas tetramitiformis]|uniref:Uncharacterized protein n=1 Tax=Cymbomonas tetramitiformis TaxID=36881 RepID=A0AAE0FRW8_9CHLO|nr:hypothetical protein CYMTET_26735 [Cymbomonas tetramitiformis]